MHLDLTGLLGLLAIMLSACVMAWVIREANAVMDAERIERDDGEC